MRQELDRDPRMHRCAIRHLAPLYGPCSGRIEWHHVWIYAGSQISEKWAIVGACHQHHEEVKKDLAIKAAFEEASLSIATIADLAKYPKKAWSQIIKALGITK